MHALKSAEFVVFGLALCSLAITVCVRSGDFCFEETLHFANQIISSYDVVIGIIAVELTNQQLRLRSQSVEQSTLCII